MTEFHQPRAPIEKHRGINGAGKQCPIIDTPWSLPFWIESKAGQANKSKF